MPRQTSQRNNHGNAPPPSAMLNAPSNVSSNAAASAAAGGTTANTAPNAASNNASGGNIPVNSAPANPPAPNGTANIPANPTAVVTDPFVDDSVIDPVLLAQSQTSNDHSRNGMNSNAAPTSGSADTHSRPTGSTSASETPACPHELPDHPGRISGDGPINVSRRRPLHPSRMIRPDDEAAARPHWVISIADSLGVMNEAQISRLDLSRTKDFRAHWFPNYDQALGFYKALFRAGILRYSSPDDYVDTLSLLWGGSPGIAPRPVSRHPATVDAAGTEAGRSRATHAHGHRHRCLLCGSHAPAHTPLPPDVEQTPGSSTNPILVRSSDPTPNTTAPSKSVRFADPPHAPSRGRRPPLPNASPATPTPLPHEPRAFPDIIEIPSDDEPSQPRKKAKQSAPATRIRKGKGKERSKPSEENDGDWCLVPRFHAQDNQASSTSLPPPREPLPAKGSSSVAGPSASAPQKQLKRKAGPSTSSGSSARASHWGPEEEAEFLAYLKSTRPSEAELAFMKMGRRDDTPSSNSGSSSTISSSTPSTSSSDSPAAAVPDASSTVPTTSSAAPNSNPPAVVVTSSSNTNMQATVNAHNNPSASITAAANSNPSATANATVTANAPATGGVFGLLLSAIASLSDRGESESDYQVSELDPDEVDRTMREYD